MATRKKATTAQEPPITAPVVFPKERVLTSRDTLTGVIFCLSFWKMGRNTPMIRLMG